MRWPPSELPHSVEDLSGSGKSGKPLFVSASSDRAAALSAYESDQQGSRTSTIEPFRCKQVSLRSQAISLCSSVV